MEILIGSDHGGYKLKQEIIKQLIEKHLTKLKEKYKKQGINIKISNEIKEKILNDSEYQEYGARKLEKVINDFCENQIIDEILNNKKEIILKI